MFYQSKGGRPPCIGGVRSKKELPCYKYVKDSKIGVMRNIEKVLDELFSYVAKAEKIDPAISSVNVGWHIEHSCLVINKIVAAVLKSDPSTYKWRFNMKRSMLFVLHRFPRGKAKAPEAVKPKQEAPVDFPALLEKTRSMLAQLRQAAPKQYFLHPYLGDLHKKHTYLMLDIHTRHHLKIVQDILK